MRFMMLMILKPTDKSEHGAVPDKEMVGAMMKYNEELSRAGVLLALDGLHPSSTGARIKLGQGKAVVVDGPFAEAKEVIGGYWMINVKSRDEAIEWAKRIPGANALDPANPGAVVEIRQVFEMADFGPEVEAAVGEQARSIDQRIGRKTS